MNMNINFDHLPKDELLNDLKQYRQELICAFSVIKSYHLEGEYLAAVKCLVKDSDIRFNILDCIVTDKRKVLGTELVDYNELTQIFIKKNLEKFFSKEASRERLCLTKEIKQLKDENRKLKSNLSWVKK